MRQASASHFLRSFYSAYSFSPFSAFSFHFLPTFFNSKNRSKGVRKATIRQLPYPRGNFRTPHCLRKILSVPDYITTRHTHLLRTDITYILFCRAFTAVPFRFYPTDNIRHSPYYEQYLSQKDNARLEMSFYDPLQSKVLNPILRSHTKKYISPHRQHS